MRCLFEGGAYLKNGCDKEIFSFNLTVYCNFYLYENFTVTTQQNYVLQEFWTEKLVAER